MGRLLDISAACMRDREPGHVTSSHNGHHHSKSRLAALVTMQGNEESDLAPEEPPSINDKRSADRCELSYSISRAGETIWYALIEVFGEMPPFRDVRSLDASVGESHVFP